MSEQAWRWGPPPPDDVITVEQLRPHGWAPGKYVFYACPRCGKQFGDCDKRSRSCRPCAVKAFKAVEAVRAERMGRQKVERAFWETPREISQEEAKAAARRLVNSHFRNEDGARVSIPANPNRDDDLILLSYIAQRERAGDPDVARAMGELRRASGDAS